MIPRFRNIVALLCLAGMQGAYALDALDDAAMSDAAGQGGLTLTINLVTGSTTGLGYTDTGGFTNFTTSADVYLRSFSTSGTFTATFDVGATGTTNASTPAAAMVLTMPATLSMTFNTNLGTGLGVGVVDMCNTPAAMGVCTPGAAGDYAVMMAPTTGVTFQMTNTNLKFSFLADESGSTHTAWLTDTAASTFTISGSAGTPNIALVDPGNVATALTTVGGIGAKSITISGLEFGAAASPSASTSVTLDLCSTNATTVCPVAKTGGNAGLLVNIGSAAMTNVNIIASGVTIGNVGSASANNGVGLMALTNLGLANTSVMIYGH